MLDLITPAILLAVLSAGPVLADRDATITVHPEAVVGKVNPLVFGSNQIAYQDGGEQYSTRGSGIWDPEKHAPVPDWRAMGIVFIRHRLAAVICIAHMVLTQF